VRRYLRQISRRRDRAHDPLYALVAERRSGTKSHLFDLAVQVADRTVGSTSLTPGQAEAKRRSPALYVFGREVAILGLGEVAGYRQSETYSSSAAGSRGVYTVEAIEDAGQVLGGYPWAGVDHAHLRPAVAPMSGHDDAPTSQRVPEGVVEEHGQDAAS
jgi:hypothetical protein